MLNCLVFIGNINCISVGHNLYFYGQKSGTALSLTWVCLPVLDLEILLSNKLYVVVELISLVFYLSEIIALHYLISSVLKTVGLIYFVCFAVVASGGSGDGGSCICVCVCVCVCYLFQAEGKPASYIPSYLKAKGCFIHSECCVVFSCGTVHKLAIASPIHRHLSLYPGFTSVRRVHIHCYTCLLVYLWKCFP